MVQSRGFFVTFEGGDGSGKTTQIDHIADRLRQRGYVVCPTREPGGCPSAEKIRSLLLDKNSPPWDPMAEYLLFSAARRQHLVDVIMPALHRGEVVLCDRFIHSSFAYQGYGHGLALETLRGIYDHLSDGVWPDVTFYLSLPVDVGLTRTKGRAHAESRFEDMGTPFHARVQGGWDQIAAEDPGRIHVIDGTLSPQQVTDQLWLILAAVLPHPGSSTPPGDVSHGDA